MNPEVDSQFLANLLTFLFGFLPGIKIPDHFIENGSIFSKNETFKQVARIFAIGLMALVIYGVVNPDYPVKLPEPVKQVANSFFLGTLISLGPRTFSRFLHSTVIK